MVPKKILILTHEGDPHAKSVCTYLSRKGVDFFCVETDKIISNYFITFDSSTGFYTLSNTTRREVIDDTWNIWNRRVMDPILPENFPKELEDIIFTETKRTWEGLLFTHKGKVINKPQANFAANNKVDQLIFAKNYGLEVIIPETVLTNDIKVLEEFYITHTKICHKLQKAALVKRGEQHLTTYNNLVNDENMRHAELIRMHPCLFQEYIDKKYELRITALDDKAVAIAIHSQDSDVSKIDFRRYDFKNVSYEKVDIPDAITAFCLDILKHYGLNFGEIDIIFTKDSRYVFLEINPNGQWLWLQEQSGYDLTQDVADNLTT